MTDDGLPPPPTVDRPEHTYHPRLWYPLSVALMGVAASLVMMGVFDSSFLTALVLPVAVPVIAWRQLRLTLSATELSVAGRATSWDRIRVVSTRWGDSLVTPPGTPLRERVRVYLPLYERRWRTGSVGADLQRWAPHVVPPPEDRVS